SQADVVRLGHPARVASGLRELSLDLLVQKHDNQRIVRDMMREAEQLFRQASRYTRSKPARGQRQELRREARELKDNARLLERQAVQHILDQADVICATTSLDSDLIGKREFDLVVIDEACQCVEPAAWIPILRAERIVLAGDHCQLPPTIISTEAVREGFAVSLLERLVRHYGHAIQRRLTVQYRMHEQIMNFSSDQFYDHELTADSTVQKHLLEDLPNVTNALITATPITYIDTAGAGWEEELEPDGESKRNPREADLVRKKVCELLDAGLAERDIAVIAPYAAQVRLLRERCGMPELEIDTVDGFQGREKEAVIITLVRSNASGEIGFLADQRRMNVALTRARRKLIVIGDSATLGGHPFYASLLEYFEHSGAYHTVWEEVDD
ncbi:MAG: IGHMBP2 family helicase, partial [Blastopirellula sp.]|nr:IGHMBP2 family helicase [Blastopirellula sp.]